MTIQLSIDVRNARLDAVEAEIDEEPILEIRSGEPPVNCAASDTGTVLAQMTLPADWMQAASNGSKAKNGTWQVSAAAATGDAGHFRIKESTGTTCHLQGTVTEDGGGGDMELQQATVGIVEGQQVTVSVFTLTDGNA